MCPVLCPRQPRTIQLQPTQSNFLPRVPYSLCLFINDLRQYVTGLKIRVSTVQFRPPDHLQSRVRQAFKQIQPFSEHPRNTLKIPLLCPMLCPRETHSIRLRPTGTKIEEKFGESEN